MLIIIMFPKPKMPSKFVCSLKPVSSYFVSRGPSNVYVELRESEFATLGLSFMIDPFMSACGQ
jgi:hypothetical protein